MRTPTWQGVLRAVTTLVTLDAFAQAMFAGRFMAGSYDALDAHAGNAGVLFAGILVMTGCFAAAWRFAGAPGWQAGVGLVLTVTAGVQIALGYRMVLAVHIPLGVMLVAGLLTLTVRAWSPVAAVEAGR
ncbi:hypothetical protein [Nocardia sp. CDC160]|uniref:hypothetical protein n=1 Tax=Nocardia sp. CDC160 TaxID=3112166 RepID=UPI002DBE2B2F|nr:hypothetical protein [Nocardia sp. CDC160]MEC3918175.1 hypothetical protein [Nocardia sp. CDC160]